MKRSLGALLVAIVGLWTGVASAQTAEELESYIGKSPKELDGQHRARFSELTRQTNVPPHSFVSFPQWQVTRLSMPTGAKRYAIFTLIPAFSVPGQATGSLHLFDAAGKPINNWFHKSGWRLGVGLPSVDYDPSLSAFRITISSTPYINGRDIAKQIYALADDKLYFIRLEDKQGNLIRNRYWALNHTIGFDQPTIGTKTSEDLVTLLRSESIVQRLAALTFLNGTHSGDQQPPEESRRVGTESVAPFRLAHEVHARPDTKALIGKYQNAAHPWLKQAAELAVTFQTER